MVFPDLFKEQISSTFSIYVGMHRDEVHARLVTLSTMFIIVSYPWDSGSSTMKSTLITSHGALGVSKGWSSLKGH
jgi:hypothetical protein